MPKEALLDSVAMMAQHMLANNEMSEVVRMMLREAVVEESAGNATFTMRTAASLLANGDSKAAIKVLDDYNWLATRRDLTVRTLRRAPEENWFDLAKKYSHDWCRQADNSEAIRKILKGSEAKVGFF